MARIITLNAVPVIELDNEEEGFELMTFDVPEYRNVPKNSKFRNFLQNNIIHIDSREIGKDVGEITWHHPYITSEPDKSIGYGLYLANNIEKASSLFYLEEDFSTRIGAVPHNSILHKKVTEFFGGARVKLPRNNSLTAKYKTFEDFTSIEETSNISLWSLAALRFLASSPEECRLGKEIQILETKNLRDGRLDICAAIGQKLLVIEAKTSITKALTEDRFRLRIPSYDTEIKRTIAETEVDYQSQILLLVGGSEYSLFPPGHPDYLEDRYTEGQNFLEKCLASNIKFVTGNFLWCCLMYSLVLGEKLAWDEFLWDLIRMPTTLGLCSAGRITTELTVEPIQSW